jgi:hypothetical protein
LISFLSSLFSFSLFLSLLHLNATYLFILHFSLSVDPFATELCGVIFHAGEAGYRAVYCSAVFICPNLHTPDSIRGHIPRQTTDQALCYDNSHGARLASSPALGATARGHTNMGGPAAHKS